MRPPPRRYARELLDADVHDPEELRRSLEQVADVNRWLGGAAPLRRHLRPLLGRSGVRILDVGAGNGAVAQELRAWAARRGSRWTVVAVDLHPQAAALARRRSGGTLPVVRGDGLGLPFADGTFDAVFSVLTLHHFDDDEAAALVREMARVGKRVVVNDLERSRLAHLGARLLAATVWRRNRLTRHDGPLSVLRSFTPSELLEVGRRAGLEAPRVVRHRPFRLVLEGR